MDYLTFVWRIVEASAWPVAALIAIWVLRPTLHLLLRLARRLRYKDLEMDFGEGIERAREEFERSGLSGMASQYAVAGSLDDEVYYMAQAYPEASVMEVYKRLEAALTRLADRLDLPSNRRSPRDVVAALAKQQRIDKHTFGVFERLRHLRNIAAHNSPGEPKLGLGEVLEYRNLAESLIARLTDLPA